ncbi:MAG: TetR/AcrR family transcriptional regulator [Flavobacteriales bacterium]
MDEKFIPILEGAARVFMQYGVKSITMDDIARELKVSKKTLYLYVSDKNDLVHKVMDGKCFHEECLLQNIECACENAIEELIAVSRHVSEELHQVHPSVIFDLQKYYPEAWKRFEEHKYQTVVGHIRRNLDRGIKEGLYRNNLDADIISRLFAAKIDIMFDPAVFPFGKYSFEHIHWEVTRYHIRGIASEKGLQYLNEIVNKKQTRL